MRHSVAFILGSTNSEVPNESGSFPRSLFLHPPASRTILCTVRSLRVQFVRVWTEQWNFSAVLFAIRFIHVASSVLAATSRHAEGVACFGLGSLIHPLRSFRFGVGQQIIGAGQVRHSC